jgi:hypothetical protein
VILPTLRCWHLEWRGSGYDPDYAIRRAGHSNWLKNRWAGGGRPEQSRVIKCNELQIVKPARNDVGAIGFHSKEA